MKILKSTLFYLLLWTRGFVVGIGRILSSFLLMGTIVMGIACTQMQPEKRLWGLVLFSGVFGFGLFMLCQFYDQILIKLNPNDDALIIEQ